MKISYEAFLAGIESASFLTKYLVISACLFFVIDLALVTLPNDHIDFPSQLNESEVFQSVPLAVARGQTFEFRIQCTYDLRFSIVPHWRFDAWAVNATPQNTLFSQVGRRFQGQLVMENYTILFLHFNNSLSDSGVIEKVNNLVGTNHVTGFDLDVEMITVSLFMIAAGVEVISSPIRQFHKKQRQEAISNYLATPSQAGEQSIERLRVYERETKRPETIQLYGALMARQYQRGTFLFTLSLQPLFFLFTNPSFRVVVLSPTSSDLTASLLSLWSYVFHQFWIIWVAFIALSILSIWRTNEVVSEIMTEWAYPVSRRIYGLAVLGLFGIGILIPLSFGAFLLAVILNLLRFHQIPALGPIGLFLITVLSWCLLLGLTSSIIHLTKFHWTLASKCLIIATGAFIVNEILLIDPTTLSIVPLLMPSNFGAILRETGAVDSVFIPQLLGPLLGNFLLFALGLALFFFTIRRFGFA
ncbi:MAG: hypothetical protein ACFFFG_17515 [Candidatus Thorarchaeota archaeon]